jgi:hypothetical protein
MGANQRSPRKLEIGPTLEKALAATLNGKLQWQPVLDKNLSSKPMSGFEQRLPAQKTDGISAKLGPVKLTWHGTPQLDRQMNVTAVNQWTLTLTHEKTGEKKILDGQTCYLPSRVSADTAVKDNTLPKLVRSIYVASTQQVDAQCDAIVPVLTQIHAALEAGEISSSKTYVKPNLKFGYPIGFQLIQIGKAFPRLELAKVGQDMKLTLHQETGVTKLNQQALNHPKVAETLESLLSLVD